MMVTSPSKSVTFRGELYLLPSELPPYLRPEVIDVFLDGPDGGDAALGLLRGVLDEDGMKRFLEQASRQGFGEREYGEFVAAFYREYGIEIS
jgi:hypothetical protein